MGASLKKTRYCTPFQYWVCISHLGSPWLPRRQVAHAPPWQGQQRPCTRPGQVHDLPGIPVSRPTDQGRQRTEAVLNSPSQTDPSRCSDAVAQEPSSRDAARWAGGRANGWSRCRGCCHDGRPARAFRCQRAACPSCSADGPSRRRWRVRGRRSRSFRSLAPARAARAGPGAFRSGGNALPSPR